MSKRTAETEPKEPGYDEWLTEKVAKSMRRGVELPHDEAMQEVETALEDFLARRRTA